MSFSGVSFASIFSQSFHCADSIFHRAGVSNFNEVQFTALFWIMPLVGVQWGAHTQAHGSLHSGTEPELQRGIGLWGRAGDQLPHATTFKHTSQSRACKV